MMRGEKTAQFASAPRLKRLKSAATPPPALCDDVRNQSCKTAGLTPGVVIAAPSLTTTMTARVNKIRRRSSGILTVFKKAETIRQARFRTSAYSAVFFFLATGFFALAFALATVGVGVSCFFSKRLPSTSEGR